MQEEKLEEDWSMQKMGDRFCADKKWGGGGTGLCRRKIGGDQ
jgi:hypothetical protein